MIRAFLTREQIEEYIKLAAERRTLEMRGVEIFGVLALIQIALARPDVQNDSELAIVKEIGTEFADKLEKILLSIAPAQKEIVAAGHKLIEAAKGRPEPDSTLH